LKWLLTTLLEHTVFPSFVGEISASPYVLHAPPISSEKNEIGGVCSTCGERRSVYRVLVGKPEEKRPFGRPMRRWEDNIKMDIEEVR
jgi:hypothetical protein